METLVLTLGQRYLGRVRRYLSSNISSSRMSLHAALLLLLLYLTKNRLYVGVRKMIASYVYGLRQGRHLSSDSHPHVESFLTEIEGTEGILSTLVHRSIHRDIEGKKHPTIIVRTPYCKEIISFHMVRFADCGFNVVVQDCKGRFASEGSFEYGKMFFPSKFI